MRRVAATCAALVLAGSAHAQGTIVGSPIDLTAHVHEATLPGATIFDDVHAVPDAGTAPKQSAEYLYFASKGQNLSGRSTNLIPAFASSLAESDGNGGVGVTSWIGGNAGSPGQTDGMNQLVSQAIWSQEFTYLGSADAVIKLELHIPAIQVGLIGVAPNRDAPSATETAQAEAMLQTTITHADGSSNPGGSFDFGLRAFERQLSQSPGVFANFADVGFIGANASTVPLFDSFRDNGDASNPRFSLDAVVARIILGTLQPGDTVSYVYTLTAEGTTHGGEHGYVAFLGDPFGLDVVEGNLAASTEPVPEPAAGALAWAELGLVAGALGRRERRTPR